MSKISDNTNHTFQVLHIEKRRSIAFGLNRHITRQQFIGEGGESKAIVWTPDNSDPTRTADNVELILREGVDTDGKTIELTIQQAVDRRLQEAGVKPRSNQHTCMEIIFSGSRDAMTGMSRQKILAWADDTLAWAKNTWGEENVVSATLHVDETTPHIHAVVVPILTGQSKSTQRHKKQKPTSRTNNIKHDKLRLCMNEVYTPALLYQYHDSYSKEVGNKYHLHRGVMAAPGSKKKHTSSIEYNRQLAVQAAEQKALIDSIQSDYTDKQTKLSDLQGQITSQEKKVKSNAAVLNKQQQQIADNELILQDQKAKISAISQISLDATEEEVAAKRSELEALNAQILQLKQSLVHLSAEVKAKNESLKQKRRQLQAQIDLKNIPKKKAFVYKSEEVESLIEMFRSASQICEMNSIQPDLSSVNSIYYKEVVRLQNIEKLYKILNNSPNLLQKRLDELQDQKNRKEVKAVIEFVLEKRVSSINSCTILETPEGKEIFATCQLSGIPTVYAVHILPNEDVYWTRDPRVTSLEKAQEFSSEHIWNNPGRIPEIKQQRESKDRGMRR